MRKVFARRFVQGFCIVVLVLAIVKEVAPAVAYTNEERAQAKAEARAKEQAKLANEAKKQQRKYKSDEKGKDEARQSSVSDAAKVLSQQNSKAAKVSAKEKKALKASREKSKVKVPHRIYSVPGYDRCFADGNDVQLASAVKYGVEPIANREEAEARKDELVYIGANPYFVVEEARSSIPYLVPRASTLLQDIGKTFFDSLQIKGIPLHKMIVTSVLRTQDDVERLQRHNTNAVPNSCHQYATTFDICYNRYRTVAPPGEERRAVRNDTLKWVLSEVLYDMKKQGRCYVKHEKKQGCFHITVR
ncbi:MAG: DUF5715 family protein [Prevotella sp.]|nr:DUF5715 family protein [Prevotella sp.]